MHPAESQDAAAPTAPAVADPSTPEWIKTLAGIDPATPPGRIAIETETAAGNLFVTVAAYALAIAISLGLFWWTAVHSSILILLSLPAWAVGIAGFLLRMLIDADYSLDTKARRLHRRIRLAGLTVREVEVCAFSAVEALRLEFAPNGEGWLAYIVLAMRGGPALRTELIANRASLDQLPECTRKLAEVIGCDCVIRERPAAETATGAPAA